ncbi:hypothetical protein RNN32_25980, partial [Escherichia coli]|nr:hypothetical protein [Escherichia coli]
KTSIFSHPVYLFLRKFSLQDSRGGSKRRLPGYAKTHDGLKVYIEPKTGRLYFKKLNKKHYIDEESVVV